MMTTGMMLHYTNLLQGILVSSAPQYFKNVQLAGLMSSLERVYGISVFAKNNGKLKREQPYVLQLYQTISDARIL